MKKCILIPLIVLLLFGCSNKVENNVALAPPDNNEVVESKTINENEVYEKEDATSERNLAIAKENGYTDVGKCIMVSDDDYIDMPVNNGLLLNMDKLKLYIDDVEVDVDWEDNDSMKQIGELAKQNPIIINSHQYGGFEQVGEIGQNIVSNNIQMTTEPGDIVLYAGNNIVVFYGSNSWSYTKLGKINKNREEIEDLLNKAKVTLKISY